MHTLAQSKYSSFCEIEGKPVNAYTKVPAPSIFTNRIAFSKTATSSWTVDYPSNFPDSARTALNYAVLLWSYLINSNQSITIDARWVDTLSSTTLAACGPTSFEDSVDNLNLSGYYAIALAEKIKNADLNNGQPELMSSL